MRTTAFLLTAALAAAICLDAALGEEAPSVPVPEGMRPGDKSGRGLWLQDGSEMVWVPAGPFPRGAANSEPDEGPAAQVGVGGFYVDKFETTNAQYRKFLDAWTAAEPEARGKWTHQDEAEGATRRPAFWPALPLKEGEPAPKQEPGSDLLSRDDMPVVGVTWFDAWAYARWAGKDLPSEAEWEKAASFEPQSKAKRVYAWGNDAPDFTRCNFGGNVGSPVRPGSYPSGEAPCGSLDMSGNVWEWCLDYYHESFYGTEAGKGADPVNKFPSAFRVLRGGSYRSTGEELRTSFRDRADPRKSFRDVGFRCVLRVGAAGEGGKPEAPKERSDK